MKSEMTGTIQGSGDISSLSMDCVYFVVYFTNNSTERLFDTLLLWWKMIPQTSSATLEKAVKKTRLNISKCFIHEANIKHILEKICSVYQAIYRFFGGEYVKY